VATALVAGAVAAGMLGATAAGQATAAGRPASATLRPATAVVQAASAAVRPANAIVQPTTQSARLAAAGRRATAGPTRREIARAVAAARRSRDLWATVNICSAGRFGVRGQMPTLGFAASLQMQIQVDYWSSTEDRFVPIASPRAVAELSLGEHATGLQQAGEVFPFSTARRARLAATVTFSWWRGRRLLGAAVRRTTGGHPTAQYGSPPGYSAAQCQIG